MKMLDPSFKLKNRYLTKKEMFLTYNNKNKKVRNRLIKTKYLNMKKLINLKNSNSKMKNNLCKILFKLKIMILLNCKNLLKV